MDHTENVFSIIAVLVALELYLFAELLRMSGCCIVAYFMVIAHHWVCMQQYIVNWWGLEKNGILLNISLLHCAVKQCFTV
jgi:hypothetical protein